MTLLSEVKSLGHLVECIAHYNRALDEKERGLSKVDISRAFFDGLNKLQTEWTIHHRDLETGELKRFQLMILHGLQTDDRTSFLRSDALRVLASLKPQIMNHDTLRRHGYRPDIEVDIHLARKASEEHRKLATAYLELERSMSHETEVCLIKRAAELLYIVRSNIAHGEKTPYGPDLAKRDRDEQVCTVIVPLQEQLFEFLLDKPSTKLVSYGTLSPGQLNHELIADVQGTWEECLIRGDVCSIGGLTVFSWNPAGQEEKAQLFISAELPAAWSRIDTFEGSRYKRRLIPIRTRAGISVANVYVGI